MKYHLIPRYKNLTRTENINDLTLFGLVSVKLNDAGETVETPYVPDNTDDSKATITGTADVPAGTLVTLVITDGEGNTQTVTAVVDEVGEYSVVVPHDLSSGDYTVTATVEDPNNNGAVITTEALYDPLLEEVPPLDMFSRNGVTLKMYDARLLSSDTYATGTVYGCLMPHIQPHDDAPGLHVVTYDYTRWPGDLHKVAAIPDVSDPNITGTDSTPSLMLNVMQLFELSSSTADTFARNVNQLADLLTSVRSLHGSCFAMVGDHTSITEYLKLSTQQDVKLRAGDSVDELFGQPDLKVSRQIPGRRRSPSTLGISGDVITAIGNKQYMSWAETNAVMQEAGVPDMMEWVQKPLTDDEESRINKLSIAFNASWFEMYNTTRYPDKFYVYVMSSADKPSDLLQRKRKQ